MRDVRTPRAPKLRIGRDMIVFLCFFGAFSMLLLCFSIASLVFWGFLEAFAMLFQLRNFLVLREFPSTMIFLVLMGFPRNFPST